MAAFGRRILQSVRAAAPAVAVGAPACALAWSQSSLLLCDAKYGMLHKSVEPVPELPGCMPRNRLLEKLRDGQPAVGHMIWEFFSRGLPRIVAQSGVDFVVIDMEHSGFGIDKLWDLIAGFRFVDPTVMVRIPVPEYSFVARALDAGAQGIMCPNVKTMEEVQLLADSMLYPPQGMRGVGLGHAQSDYAGVDAPAYVRAANLNNCLICQIESVEALAIIDQIAAHPAVDVLWIGHFDLTASMGILGEFQNPKFFEALRKTIDAAHRHGKAAAIQPGNVEQAREWKALGFDVLSFGTDHLVYAGALKAGVAAVRELK